MSIIPDLRVVLVQAIGFILVLVIFKLFLFKPIAAILDARRREVEEQFERAETQRRTADEFRTEYERHLAQIDQEMRAKIAEAVKEGQTMREEILSDSRTQADIILSKTQEEIRRERDKALFELKSTVAGLTIEAASKLIQQNLDTEAHRQLVSRFIDDLDEVAK